MISKTDPLRAAIIGCGSIAYEHLPFIAVSERAKLVAVCDRSLALATAAGERYGAETIHVEVGKMLAEVEPDVVHVLTPPQTHEALVREALRAGASVVCEKPMAQTAQKTAVLLEAAERARRTLVESRNLLWNDSVIILQQMIAERRFGDIVECDILLSLNFLSGPFGDQNLEGPGVCLPGGAVHDFLPHLTYLFLTLSGEAAVDDVRGTLLNRSGNPRVGYDFIDALVDTGRVHGRLRISTDAYPETFRIFLRGTQGSAEVDLYNPYLRYDSGPYVGKRSPLGQIINGTRLVAAGFANFRNKVMQHGAMHGLPRMLDSVYRAIQNSEPAPISPAAMLATARLNDQLIALAE